MLQEMYGEIRGALGREHVAKGNVIRIQYEIGGLLNDLKAEAPHGDFGKICDAEFGMTTATANSYMRLVTDFPSLDYILENFNSKYAAIESLKVRRPKRVVDDGLGPDNALPGGDGDSNLKGPLDSGDVEVEDSPPESEAGPIEKSKALDPPAADVEVEDIPPESDGHINQSGGEDDDPISPASEKAKAAGNGKALAKTFDEAKAADDRRLGAAREKDRAEPKAAESKPKADVKADVKALKKEVKDLRFEVKSQDNRIQLLTDQNRAVQRKYRELKRANDKVLADRDAARKRAEDAEGRVADLEADLAALRAEKGKADAVADAEMMGMDPEKAAQVQAAIDMANEQAAA